MKKNGFTLIEILAVIVIIGIVGTIAIVSVSQNILSSRDSTIVNLAKNYMESARTMRAEENLQYSPKKNEVVVIPCDQINGTEIEHKDTTGYGDVLKDYCYVGIKNDGNDKYSYYMTLVDDTYHMLIGKEYNSVSEDDILDGSENLTGVSRISSPFNSFGVKYDNNTYNIKAIRVKYSATYQDGGTKTATLYGYYTNDSGSNMNAHIKGTINELDSFISDSDNTLKINGRNFTVVNHEIMYIVLDN